MESTLWMYRVEEGGGWWVALVVRGISGGANQLFSYLCFHAPADTCVCQKKGVWIKEQGNKLKDGGPITNKQIIILLYIDLISYANFSLFSITFN